MLVGIAACLGANVPTFIVASQVYGDLYVLILIGFLIGIVFSAPKVVFARTQHLIYSDKEADVSIAYRGL